MNAQRSPSDSPCRRPHASPTDHREAFRRPSTAVSTARACLALSTVFLACPARGASASRQGLRATLPRFTSISYALDRMAWILRTDPAESPAPSIAA